mgnify:CR=1 FL=1
MRKKICPFCREKIQCAAVVCRYCKRDLPAPPPRKSAALGTILVTATAMVVASALVVVDFLKERDRWLKG